MRMSSWALAPAPPAKNVVVYRNGDPFFPGRRLVVSPRRFLTFEAFLTEVTRSVGAPLAVRNLYTPQHGHRIAALGDLQDGHQYVAAGFEKFKKLDYLRHGRTEPRGTRKGEGLRLRAAAPWKPDIRTRWQRCGHLPRTIHVFRNGDLLSPPFPVPLPQGAPRHWDALLATLTERAALRSGAVGRLCRLDGTPMSCEEELRNGGYYVAVGNEEYKKLPYFELLVPQDSGCGTLRNHPNSRRGKLGRRFGDLPAASRVGAGGAALAEPPQQLQRRAGKHHLKGEESVFYTKPIPAGRSRRSDRTAQQEGSVHKTRDPRKETRGVRREDKRTRVDTAIDQAQAADKSQMEAKKRDTSDSEDGKHWTMLPSVARSLEEPTEGE
ncbi:doublecortin domain-containing protein 2B isoform X4 [Cuculus canorus]|uniref:doublecortin domain-containing protein 2B isoform X4 n=1 Tax=Cuculus canorus TaxID=55661 RepID=UPI0023AA45B2|nr:doublecortin domain-containing protein 2B isoform X4 [Cuculus canorus]